MHTLVSVVLLALLPFATGEKCKVNGGQCDQICGAGTVPGSTNDCPGTQYCCVKKTPGGPKADTPKAGGQTPSAADTPAADTKAPAEAAAQREHFADNILVCSALRQKYVGSNRETLTCNSDQTSLQQLYRDGFRLIQIVEDGKKAIYYLERR